MRLCKSARGTTPHFAYDDTDLLWHKVHKFATLTYGASNISASASVRAQIQHLLAAGAGLIDGLF